MIRANSVRLFALIAGVAVVMSCDAGEPTGIGTIGGGNGNGGTPGGDTRGPTAEFVLPVANANVNVGDSILVGVRLRDAGGVKSLAVAGLKITGNPDLGTQVIVERYPTIRAEFPEGFARSDTVVYRVLRKGAANDTLADSLVLRAIATDATGLVDTATQVIRLVKGPQIRIVSPVPNDSIRPGTQLNVVYAASHRDGVTSVRVIARSSAGTWPTPLLDTIVTAYGTADVLDTVSFAVPADAPQRTGRITVEASALAGGYEVSASPPVTLSIRSTIAGAPLVKQTVPTRAERADSVFVEAIGDNGLVDVGVVAIAGVDTFRATPFAIAGAPAEFRGYVRMNLPATMQGQTVRVISYATDAVGLRGYSVPRTASIAVDSMNRAHADQMLVAYGRTYSLPRPGLGGDIAVDVRNGNVFVSNTAHNRLEVWHAPSQAFDAQGIAVGAEPWGLTTSSRNPNELLVANSGGTNISRVDIGQAAVADMDEVGRILTRNTISFSVTESVDPMTGVKRVTAPDQYSYSDRPQYIAQAAGGRIYYSTRPTTAAPEGTIRYLDPTHPYPDSRQIWQYGSASPEFAIINADWVNVTKGDSLTNDYVQICDHATGTNSARICAGSSVGTFAALDSLRVVLPTTDVVVAHVSLESLKMTDTTFVAWSGDRSWVALGEGNVAKGRVLLSQDPGGTALADIYFSEGIDVQDLIDNASEQVFGLALDTLGRAVAVHGAKSYFGSVESPFHLRMQGGYDSFDLGAGIAFHPRANVNPASPGDRNDKTRVAFVASENGSIEIVDAYYYVSRGRVAVRSNLYGPLRTALPTAAEAAAGVFVKVYGLTADGLVIIDLRADDIKDAP